MKKEKLNSLTVYMFQASSYSPHHYSSCSIHHTCFALQSHCSILTLIAARPICCAMARRPHRAHPYTATSEVPTETGPQTTPWYGFGRASQEGRPDPRRSMPNRPVLIIVDYSPLQELTHQSVPDRALLTAMHPTNLRNTTATEHEALFTYARILEPNEVPAVQIQHLRPLMVIRLRT